MLSPNTFDAALAELAFAYQKVRFYRSHLDAAGLTPATVRTEAEWQRVPFTQKRHYRAGFPASVLAEGRRLDEPGLYRSQSSGTEGDRLVTVCETGLVAERWRRCLELRNDFTFLERANKRSCRYAAPNCSDVECANPNSTMADRVLADQTLVLPVYHDLLTTPAPMLERSAEELCRYEPQLLYVDPTHLAFLVRFMRGGRWALPAVRGIVLTYTLPTRVSRAQIAAYFAAVPVAEVASMTEFGWLAMQCQSGTLHLNTVSYHLELLTPSGPAEPSELGELVVTSLGDRLSPHVRYQTGDLYRRVAGGCSCGSAFPAVTLEGRRKSAIHRGGALLLTARDVDELIGAPEGLSLYQLEQRAERDFVLRYLAEPSFSSALAGSMAERLTAALGEGAALRLEATRYIPAERSGKFMSCKSALAPA